MSEADKLFEELEYEKKTGDSSYIEYVNTKEDVRISFYKRAVKIRTNTGGFSGNPTVVYMQELKAINMKVKELDWEENEYGY